MDDEIETQTECPDCYGEGLIWNNCDPTSGQCVDCDTCGGDGWIDLVSPHTTPESSQ